MSTSEINLVVQISGKRSAYIERVNLGPNGLTIGRAWDSDIIIQDKFVDAAQLKLSLNEQDSVAIEDLDSTNGSMLSNRALNGQAQIYHWGDVIRVGDSTIRIFDKTSQVEGTASRSIWYSLQKILDSRLILTAMVLAASVIATLSAWAFSQEPLSAWELLVDLISSVGFLLLWTLVFGSIGKLVQGQSNMRAHLGLVSVISIIATVLTALQSVVLFNLQSPTVGHWFGLLIYGGLFFTFCFALLTYTTHLSSQVKWICSALLIGGAIAATESDSFLKEEHELWSSRSNSELTTLPSAFMWREPVTLDVYFDETNQLFDQLIEKN